MNYKLINNILIIIVAVLITSFVYDGFNSKDKDKIQELKTENKLLFIQQKTTALETENKILKIKLNYIKNEIKETDSIINNIRINPTINQIDSLWATLYPR